LTKVSNTQANLTATPPANAQFAPPAINVRVVATNGQRASVQIINVRLFNRAAPTFVAFSVPPVTVGTAMTPVTIRTTGFPFPAITSVGNALPAGLTLTNNGDGTATISGTPTGPAGVSTGLRLRATNNFPNPTQGTVLSATFSITVAASLVSPAPAFLSPTSATFAVGTPGTFTVTTGGYPKPTITRTASTLPVGLTFTDNGDGTATFESTAATPADTYFFTLKASNGSAPDVFMTFTLTIA
jgi:hypothetical protein